MIRKCIESEFEAIRKVINESAKVAYKERIPADLYRVPWMRPAKLEWELRVNKVNFACFVEQEKLQGVMGVKDFPEVRVIRHSYVHPARQRGGIGSKLLQYHLGRTRK